MRYVGRKLLTAVAAAAVVAVLVLADRHGLFGTAPRTDVEKYHLKRFRVCRVVDGDTLDVDAPDGPHSLTRVRLWGVDTPETVKENTAVQHFGPRASRFTKAAAGDKTVTLQLEPRNTRDRYGRLLAYVILPDGQMLNRVLVAEGYGYADPRFEHRCKSEFARLQRHAMKARAGLWRDVRREDLPYYYRDRLKLAQQ